MKTVLITGGARGIGKAISEKFAQNGYNVVINYSKSEESAYRLSQAYPNIRTFKADISNKKEVQALVDFAEKEFKHVDILVNNAGISSCGLLQDLSEEYEISPSRISRIIRAGLDKIKAELIKNEIV